MRNAIGYEESNRSGPWQVITQLAKPARRSEISKIAYATIAGLWALRVLKKGQIRSWQHELGLIEEWRLIDR